MEKTKKKKKKNLKKMIIEDEDNDHPIHEKYTHEEPFKE